MSAKPESSQQDVDESHGVEDLGRRLDELLASTPVGLPFPTGQFTIGRFRVGQALGYGSFGVVYAAHDTQINRDVAIKLPRPEVLADTEKRERFSAEANLAATLDHPGIVPIYEARLDGPMPFIVSKLVPGPDLAEWLEEANELPGWQSVCRFTAKIARAVCYAHSHGISHRDLKPSNILLAQPDSGAEAQHHELDMLEPQITDFGLAKLIDSDLTDTRSSLVVGTPLYMAPEQFDGENGEYGDQYVAIDIYSMGVMLFEMLAGHPPRDSGSYGELLDSLRSGPPSSLSEACKGIPRDLDRICQKCMARNPAARYSSAEKLAHDLEDCAAGNPVRVESPSLKTRFNYWIRQKKRVADAGWFTMWSQLVFIVWLIAGFVAASFGKSMSRADYFDNVRDLVLVISTVMLPLAFVGAQTVREKPWAILAGLLLSGMGCLSGLVPLYTGPLLFKAVYADEDAFVVMSMHLLIAANYVSSFLLYLFAWMGARERASR